MKDNNRCMICQRRIATHTWNVVFKVCLLCKNDLEERQKMINDENKIQDTETRNV